MHKWSLNSVRCQLSLSHFCRNCEMHQKNCRVICLVTHRPAAKTNAPSRLSARWWNLIGGLYIRQVTRHVKHCFWQWNILTYNNFWNSTIIWSCFKILYPHQITILTCYWSIYWRDSCHSKPEFRPASRMSPNDYEHNDSSICICSWVLHFCELSAW